MKIILIIYIISVILFFLMMRENIRINNNWGNIIDRSEFNFTILIMFTPIANLFIGIWMMITIMKSDLSQETVNRTFFLKNK